MKTLRLLLLSTLPFTFFCLGSAKPLDVFFGTGGRGVEGIYHATFNPDNGKFSPARLAAKIGSPGWLAPAMIACFVIGLVYIVIYYVAGSQIPIMNSIGGAANGLVNVAIGFAFIITGFILSTKWK